MLLIVNSADRNINYYYNTPTQFQILFTKILKNVKKVKLTNVILPNVIYNVTNANNVLNWTVSNNIYQYVIPPGFYTITNLLTTIQNGMNNIINNNYVLTFSPTTQLVTISATNVTFNINFNVANSCYALLGFLPVVTPPNISMTGVNAPSLINPVNLFLTIQELGINTKVLDKECTFYIPLVNQNSTLLYLNKNDLGKQVIKFFYPQNITTLTVTLTDESGNLINLLGLDWTFILDIEVQKYDCI